jgi:hypothetical protein
MTNPYRAMCAELLLFSEEAGEICMNESLWPKSDPTCTLQQRARALLAQPEQVAPTVMEIIELHTWLEDEWRANNDGEDLPMVDFARAVLAKWGHQ